MRDLLDTTVSALVDEMQEQPTLSNAGTAKAGDRQPPPAEVAMYCFKRCGATGYQVAFGGKTQLVPRKAGQLIGLDYIRVLLQRESEHHKNPHRVPDKMSPAKVARVAAGAPPDQTESEEPEALLDNMTWKQAQKRLDELNRIIKYPGVDTANKVEAQDELDRLERQLASDTRPGANGKPQSKTFATKRSRTHGAIRNAINRSIGTIQEIAPKLADHLRDHIDHTSGGHRYTPASPSRIDWDLG
jgi:hypothetical protein